MFETHEKYLIYFVIPVLSSKSNKVALCHFLRMPLIHILVALLIAMFSLTCSHSITIRDCGLFHCKSLSNMFFFFLR